MEKPTWITTRDGSPTLWSNELSESFRSVRGAFTESYKVFIEPCLAEVEKHPRESISVGEFGLGPGTNWMMAQLFLRPRAKRLAYFAIERDASFFAEGLLKWKERAEDLARFATTQGQALSAEEVRSRLELASTPLIIPTLEAATLSGLRADFWFHDPFGYDVNPDGYTEETLKKCRVFFKTDTLACTYACNRYFQNVLEKTGYRMEVLPSGDPLLKRERLLFR